MGWIKSRALVALFVVVSTVLVACTGPSTGAEPSLGAGAREDQASQAQIGDELDAVTCSGTSQCIAVGWVRDYARNIYLTLIEENTGSGWTIVPSPTVNSGLGSVLSGISCATPTYCIAVGVSMDRTSHQTTLIEENTGKGWAIVPSPNANSYGGTGSLSGVTCPTARHCLAVGRYQLGGHFQTLIEENVGGDWTIVASPNTSNGEDNELGSVACASANRCIAVGTSGIGTSGFSNTLIEENTGTGWTIVSSPRSSSSASAGLTGVTCPSSTLCIAVGWTGLIFPRENGRPHIVENTDGRWTNVATAGTTGVLNGVACTSAIHCFAVGDAGNGSHIEENSGSGWTTLPALTISGSDIYSLLVKGVACAAAIGCLIVGAQFVGAGAVASGTGKTLVAENVGSGWTVVKSPNYTPDRSR